MKADEINPNHPVTQALHDKWPYLCAILLRKFGKSKATITLEDLLSFSHSGLSICARGNQDDIELFLVDAEEGLRMAREAGGLPV
jgi:hypothetical protein